ncbi:FG-GAP repeat protein [Cellulophaga algicola DSM 14237]|uniref:FG-GAP repeat protein n=1 Tax=Cellulophaga algicola (strain DSM 14237 / IC166 / ACAM 630) TaxID=688270 RepID=E6X8X8_CELAD|nr:VCBS repeat-containing protein [Cellulophaga algicola]ADV49749.1 FG-GAP repeat protein [Cellulophaga algicola DSM 14237]
MKSLLKIITVCCLLLSCTNSKKEKKEPNNTPEEKGKLFTLIDQKQTNITFNNHIEENFNNFFAVFNYVYNGAGVAIGDINNDGLSDIYFVGNEVPNKLYLNKGNLVFEDITNKANVAGGKGWHNGVVMADINGDGLQDIYICRGGHIDTENDRKNLLYINQGDSTFKEEAKKYGLDDSGYSLMASFFDLDNDNDLDLYLTNRPNKFFMGYEQVLQGKAKEEDMFRDKLFINENGTFKELGKTSGIKNNYGYGLGLATADFNSDGYTDIMVANDYLERDYLYINQKNKTFEDQIEKRFNHIPFYAMGIDVVDFNNDGFEDIIQLEMLPEDYERSKTTMASMNIKLFKDLTNNGFHYQYMHNQLQLNRGNGIYSDIAQYSGISKTDWSWSCLGSDFDNDGYRDLYITNGFKRDIWDKDANAKFSAYMRSATARTSTNEENAQYIINLFKENKISNYSYKNNGDLTFTKKTEDWGMQIPSFSNGAAVADLDNDGDLDLIVNNIDDPAFIYQNNAEKIGNNYIKIKLEGPKNNTTGLGAKITIRHNNKKQFYEFKTVRGYLSSVEPITHFGLGKDSNISSLEVAWADGKYSTLTNVKANQQVTINYKSAITIEKNVKITNPIFKDITTHIKANYKHEENIFDDFKSQLLLPHKLSQNGPCLAIADINNDGLDDFYVGGASGQSGAIYTQLTTNRFEKLNTKIFNDAKNSEDVGAHFFDADSDGDLDLYVVSGGNEFNASNPTYKDRLYLNIGDGNYKLSPNLPSNSDSGSCVISHDFDSDGDLDLFVGGRLVPNKYPSAPKSYLLKNTNGIFTDVTKTLAPELATIGMVTSAVWVDIDNDEIKELVLVGEWMPISIFKKEGDKFVNITSRLQLEHTVGWWNKIVAKDIDKDGDIDFVLGNLGLNYKFKATKKSPFIIYADDFDANGTNDIFLTQHYKNRQVPVRGKQCASEQLPQIGQKFKTYQEFAKAAIKDIIPNVSKALMYEAQMFESIILTNDNGVFKIKKLPMEAQFSVINGIVIDDFNNDTILDILIAGNKFEVEVETTRADASIGLLFLGKTNGDYKPVNHLESGILLPDNVKDIQKIRIGNTVGILTAINNQELRLLQMK